VSYARELEDFVDAVRSRRAPSITLDDGRRALALADAAVESAKTGRAVPVS
jgi:myo-inositol 2-dehydrogenase/D-chiro-inositol 1-dehydrogenase